MTRCQLKNHSVRKYPEGFCTASIRNFYIPLFLSFFALIFLFSAVNFLLSIFTFGAETGRATAGNTCGEHSGKQRGSYLVQTISRQVDARRLIKKHSVSSTDASYNDIPHH